MTGGGRASGARIVLESPSSIRSQALQAAFFAEIASLYPGWAPDGVPPVEPAQLEDPAGAWAVALVDGDPVGCGGLQRVDTGAAEIRRVYVDPAARGRGIARLLLAVLEGEGRRLGYRRLRLTTGDRQPAALALFRAAGYEAVPAFDDNPFAAHWLEKTV